MVSICQPFVQQKKQRTALNRGKLQQKSTQTPGEVGFLVQLFFLKVSHLLYALVSLDSKSPANRLFSCHARLESAVERDWEGNMRRRIEPPWQGRHILGLTCARSSRRSVRKAPYVFSFLSEDL